MSQNHFEDVLATRYSGQQMANLFSPRRKVTFYRDIWIALAEAEQELGIKITHSQIAGLKDTRDKIDFDRIDAIEKETKHDVVAHIRAWGEVAGAESAKIIHLGATSALVTDNADILQQREGLKIIHTRLIQLMRVLTAFALDTMNMMAVGYTHFQPAQPVTIGKRACLWLQDVLMDLEDLNLCVDGLRCLGAKGATGTQESFLELFKGDNDKVNFLDTRFSLKLGMNPIQVSGQTYTRKMDVRIADVLANIGITMHKMGTDLRLLAHTGEIRENFSNKQVGSSAMPYKRNPMQAERLCSLSKLMINYRDAIVQSTATQWLERTLDDSAMRRVTIPDQFMAADGALRVAINLVSKMAVDEKRVAELLNDHLVFASTEMMINKCVEKGMSRQDAHEKIRDIAMRARMKPSNVSPGSSLSPAQEFNQMVYNELKDYISLDDLYTSHKWTGMAADQGSKFIKNSILHILDNNATIPEFTDAVSK